MTHSEQTVFIVDDDPYVRTSLARLLESAGWKTACFASAEEFLAGYNPAAPGCLVLDMRLEAMSGLELQTALKSRNVRIPVIIISAYAEVRKVVDAMKEGAVDFLKKPFADDALLSCVSTALERDVRIREKQAALEYGMQRLMKLTPRERQTMDLLAAGKSTKEIATELQISPKTVDNHRHKVLQKLQVDGVVGLVHLLYRMELSDSPIAARRLAADPIRPGAST